MKYIQVKYRDLRRVQVRVIVNSVQESRTSRVSQLIYQTQFQTWNWLKHDSSKQTYVHPGKGNIT